MKGIINYHTLKEYLNEENFPMQDPIISDLLYRQELTLISATAKTGKTWLALHMALAVANGTKFLGFFETVKTSVLLVQTEVSHPQFRERILLLLKHFPMPWEEENIAISQERFRIDTPEGLDLLSGLIALLKPGLLILDPLYTLHKKDEDKAKDVAPMLSDLKKICVEQNTAILLIHHQGKISDTSGAQTGHQARGSSAMADVPDNLWSLRRTKESGILRLSFELRNLPAREPISLKLSPEMEWQILDLPKDHAESISEVLAKFVRESGEIKKEALFQEFYKATGKGPRTAERCLKTALSEGKFQKRLESKEVIYFVPNFTTTPLTNDNPLGDGNLANVSHGTDNPAQLAWEAK